MRFTARWGRLRSPAIFWSFVPAVVVLAVAAVLAFLAYERVTQEEAIGRERELTYVAANRLAEEMHKFSEELSTLARTEAAYHGRFGNQASALSAARRRLSIFDGGVVLLDSFGRVKLSQPQRNEITGQDWSDRFYFRQLLAGDDVAYSSTLADGPGGTPVIVVAVPITSPEGEFLGVLTGMFRLGQPTLSAFYASILRLRVGTASIIYVVDGAGQLLYHPDLERIGDSLPNRQLVNQAIRGQVGAARMLDWEGKDVVLSFAPVPGTPWGLIREERWMAVMGPSRSYGRFLLLLLVLGIVMPATGFALLARQRRAEAVERARIEEQLRVARLIQQTLLPKEVPDLPGWQIGGHYQPAQAVGGDFYDFLPLENGELGMFIGDVTDKGVPAALVMATTRSLLRSTARQVHSPGLVLQRVNNLLHQEIPPKMFVTCLYAVLDPASGRLRFANAGHNLPQRSHTDNGHVGELRARGMPLGLMPGMRYEEVETMVEPGECILFYSDGLVEAHNPRREMFGTPRLQRFIQECPGNCPGLISYLLAQLQSFSGKGWEQEDDVTLVTLQRTAVPEPEPEDLNSRPDPSQAGSAEDGGWRVLAEFSLHSEPGNEREAMRRVTEAIRSLDLPVALIDRLKTAVAETTMNAIEHGNKYRSEMPVGIRVLASAQAIAVQITDQGSGLADAMPQTPDLDAKLAGLQPPRGWGRFLVSKMADGVRVIDGKSQHTVELLFSRKGEENGG